MTDLLTLQIGRRERIFPVGRLDKDSTGLLLLTNDGRFVNALLRSAHGHYKNYIVTVNQPLSNEFIANMRSGVTITTEAQRDGRTKTLTAPTMPCRVVQVHTLICSVPPAHECMRLLHFPCPQQQV
jgi:pseudouridine synthase